jgi:hypothetical protein
MRHRPELVVLLATVESVQAAQAFFREVIRPSATLERDSPAR